MESGLPYGVGKTSGGLFTNKGAEVVNVQDRFKEQEVYNGKRSSSPSYNPNRSPLSRHPRFELS